MVGPMTEQERKQELAQMLGGVSPATLESAAELLRTAEEARNPGG